MENSITISYFQAESSRLYKAIEDTYSDIFPQEYGRVGSTEYIYQIREELQQKIADLREKLFENHVVMFGEEYMKTVDEVGIIWKKLNYTNFSMGGCYTIVNKKYEHIVDAFIENNNVEIYYAGNGVDTSDMLHICENFPSLYDEDLHFELGEKKQEVVNIITIENPIEIILSENKVVKVEL